MNISIIIPLYNKGDKIVRSVNSVLLQNYSDDFEILVVDDGSDDGCEKYIKSYSDSRIRLISKKNGGVSSARNLGIIEAQYDWIVFLDADDEMLPGTLEAYSLTAQRYPDATMIVSRQNNNYEGHGYLQFYFNRWNPTFLIKKPFFYFWLRLYFPCPGTVCIKRNEKNALFDIRMSFYEDIDYMRKNMSNRIIAYTSHVSLNYYQEESGLSSSSHAISKEMAFYIPEILNTKTSFWERVLLFENVEMQIFWWSQQGNLDNVSFYKKMRDTHFGCEYRILHWIRQKLIRRNII